MNNKFKLIKRLILFFIGMIIIQIGVALFLKSNMGSDPFTVFNQGLGFMLNITTGNANRIILFIVGDKIKIEYRWVRMVTDLCYLIIEFLLGGVVGIGTIISALLTGPFVQLCLPYGKKFVNIIMGDKKYQSFDCI
ncbi:MAG: hypothetical protein P4L35_11285 [Ignavibacteriaceae bacterium]|nr:hypothetical protein [Ignavibacteriaceae bacterium]